MEIKFLTLNIWQGGILFGNVLTFIQSQDPDVMCLQEVQNEGDSTDKWYHTYDIFKKTLTQKYSVFVPTFMYKYGGKKVYQGNAIFSKFPIVKTETTFYDIPPDEMVYDENHADYSRLPRNVVYAIVDTGKVHIHVFNAHGIWGFDGEDSERRLRMSNILVEKVKNKSRVILSGDFNTFPHTKTIHDIEKHLKNIFKNQLTTTFNMKQKSGGNFYHSVVDYIFVSKDIAVLKKEVPRVDVSDHLPLMCVLKI